MKGIYELEDAIELDEAEEQNNLLVVDALNLAFRFKQQSTFDHSAQFMRLVNSLAKSYRCKHILITCDYGNSKYRKAISNGVYKSNREELREQQSEEEKEKFQKFFEGFEKAMELCATMFPLVKLKGVEADDVAGYVVKKYSDRFDNVWLISSDKDWDLLLKPNVHRFSYVTRAEYTLGNFAETHDGCESPEDYVSMKVFAGDSGDCVAGFQGVGTKRAYNLIRQYGTALDVYDAIPLPGNQKYISSINSDPEKIILNYELMDLLSFCEEAINYTDSNNLNYIDSIMESILSNE